MGLKGKRICTLSQNPNDNGARIHNPAYRNPLCDATSSNDVSVSYHVLCEKNCRNDRIFQMVLLVINKGPWCCSQGVVDVLKSGIAGRDQILTIWLDSHIVGADNIVADLFSRCQYIKLIILKKIILLPM